MNTGTTSTGRILNSLKLDFFAAKAGLRLPMIVIMVLVMAGAGAKQPYLALALVLLFSVILGGTVFSTLEKNHADVMYGVLPLKKIEIIIGRYLYALIISVVALIVGSVFALAISRIFTVKMDNLTFLAVLSVAFAYYCFAVAVAYPLYFRFGFTKAYIFTMVPTYFLGVVGVILMGRHNFTSNLNSVIQFFTAHQYLMPIFGVAGGLVLLVISVAVANAVVARAR
ncbi:MAG: ABC-2 transporter permease [Coriobacteriia bacterium]|nr:ABC-2 transporter permease [Coriobacteriia bacterium]